MWRQSELKTSIANAFATAVAHVNNCLFLVVKYIYISIYIHIHDIYIYIYIYIYI